MKFELELSIPTEHKSVLPMPPLDLEAVRTELLGAMIEHELNTTFSYYGTWSRCD